MGNIEDLLAKIKWLINELDDARDSALHMQHALELAFEAANGTERPRIAPVAALSLSLAPTDTSTPDRHSEVHTPESWMARRGNIPLLSQLVPASIEEARGQAGL